MSERTAIITFDSRRGFFFGEDLQDHISVFLHQRQVAGSRFLHINDLVSYERVESSKEPGKFEGRNIVYTGHVDAAVKS